MVQINDYLNVGIQSWSFRGLKNGNDDIVNALKECGVDCLEITSKHVDFNNPNKVDSVIELYKSNNVKLTSCGVCNFTKDEKANRNIFEFAKKADIKAISADFNEDALPLCEKLCNEYGIKLAIHNHGKRHLFGNFDKLDEIFSKTTSNIGLCMDLAWMMHAGHDPVEALKRYEGRVYGIHFKDFVIDGDEFDEVVLDKGDLNLKECVALIQKMDTILYTSIEYEEDEENPIPRIKQCVEALKEYL